MLVLFCVGIMPIIFAEEVNAASSYENQVLNLVNQERSKAGLPSLRMDKDLSIAANKRAKEINVLFSHKRPDGKWWYTVSPKANGENIAWGQKSPKDVMNTWMNSRDHRNNILSRDFKSIGIGYHKTNSHYWVQLFGNKNPSGVGNTKGKLKTPSFSLISGKKKITVKWNKVSNAAGYQIYRSTTKNGAYSLKKTITKGSTTKYTDQNLKKIKYYYIIRSYTNVNGKGVYSSLSPVKSKTPK